MRYSYVLIVDDDAALLEALSQTLRLRTSGLIVETASSPDVALERISGQEYDAVVTDVRMPEMDGLDLLTEIRKRLPETPALLITGHGDYDLVVKALRCGAFDFIPKPIDTDYLIASLQRAIQTCALHRSAKQHELAVDHRLHELESIVEERERTRQKTDPDAQCSLQWLASPKGEMRRVAEQILQVAQSPLTVLVEGESGTGKELVSREIHRLSTRGEKPFLAIDCGAIPETLIESELFGHHKGAFTGAFQGQLGKFLLADGGTMFLDEIANLPFSTQAKLLRALQERQIQPLGSKQTVKIDVRFIAASNVPLIHEVQAGRFRRDLFYRLNEFLVSLPPLRAREDVLDLANEFLLEACEELGRPGRTISEAAAKVLLSHNWPGNVRELRNVIRRAILLTSRVIQPEHLCILSLPRSEGLIPNERELPGSSLREVALDAASRAEERAIRWALQSTSGNKSEAARLLQTDYKTLYVKIKRHGLSSQPLENRHSPAVGS